MATRCFIASSIVLLTCCGLARAEGPPAREEARIPVLAWVGVPATQTTAQRYRELADCGFTINFTSFPNIESAVKALDVAKNAGVQVLVSCPELSSDPEATARRLKDHPGLAGYFLRDEPSAGDFGALKTWADKIRSADPKHIVYVNLFPDYATAAQLGTPTYADYVDGFMATVPASFLSFDYYPIVGRNVRADWYQNLEIISAAARKAGKPFWAFALSLRHFNYPIATLPNLREQVYSDLAYGAQGIQYFTYWKPEGLESGDSLIDAEGKRTAVYDRVKQMNAEVRALSGVFLGAKVVSIGHTGDRLPAGTRAYVPTYPVRQVRTEGAGAIVSTLCNGPKRYLVLVNRDIEHAMKADVQFDGAARIEQIDKGGAPRAIDGSDFSGEVAAGDAVVFEWAAK